MLDREQVPPHPPGFRKTHGCGNCGVKHGGVNCEKAGEPGRGHCTVPHSFCKYQLRGYCVAGTMLGAAAMKTNKLLRLEKDSLQRAKRCQGQQEQHEKCTSKAESENTVITPIWQDQ